MQFRNIAGILLALVWPPGPGASAQQADSLRQVDIDGVTVQTTFAARQRLSSPLGIEVADSGFLREYFTGNLVQALGHIPGVRSMDIGSGFSKPVIRGMGFNRIAVLENGVKQEGQQWGADHGLEMDAFNAGRVVVRKGPSSLMYGSDAMGGAIEVLPAPPPAGDGWFGEAVLFGKSVNGTVAGSLMAGMKQGRWHVRARYSEQHFGDYRVPTDTVVYLTRKIPVYGGRLKNTAGYERDASLLAEYRAARYYMNYAVSNAYQKTGFFPGAHGIPDLSVLEHDGSYRNIELPYNTVNHLKFTTRQQYSWKRWITSLDLGYQNNRRYEMSRFHTHYPDQPAPERDPDRELFFDMHTLSATARARSFGPSGREHTLGLDVQYQDNRIGGYSFLLPEYTRLTAGIYWIATWNVSRQFTLTGGVRYDYGRVNISAFEDGYLAEYLLQAGYPAGTVDSYRWRSYAVDKTFGDVSASAGFIWTPAQAHTVKFNVGRSFRLPGANELASNGVHHGTFRHERGDPGLGSEKGWQADAGYGFDNGVISIEVSPFASLYNNYIYLRPTGKWSLLPHSGQVYAYTGVRALFAGAELSVEFPLPGGFGYSFTGDYVYTRNRDDRIPVSFSPPPAMRNTLSWRAGRYGAYVEMHTIARQDRVARNEASTPGANLLNAGASLDLTVGRQPVEITLLCGNILDRKYYNHLSFYRHVEIPEPGRNFQLTIKIPFKTSTR